MPDKPVLSEKEIESILDAAMDLQMRAPTLVNGNVQHAIGALSIALGTAAAMAKLPYVDLIAMLSRHYEQQLLSEVADELKKSLGITLPEKQGGSN